MYQSYQLITGAPLTGDADPSITPPSATRVFAADSAQTGVLLQLLDGTSATAAVWTSPDGTTWTALAGATGTVNAATPIKLAVTASYKIFVRLTSVTGTPTACVVMPVTAAPSLLTQLAATKGIAVLKTAVDAVTTAVGTVTTAVGNVVTGIATLLGALRSARSCVAITPHDTNTITATRAIIVTGAGNLVAKFADDAGTVTLAVLPGQYDYSLILVHTSTTATGLFALY